MPSSKSKVLRFTVRVVLGLLGLLVITSVLLLWRLSVSPIQLNKLTPSIQRVVSDLPGNFAIQIEGWDLFAEIRDRLITNGFKDGKSLQRVVSPAGMPVDIVPFGGIADKNSNIQWPPSGDVEMDVAGFQEAHQSAIQVLIQQDPPIQIPVASPQGLALLKIIAWDDRDHDLRAKDAKDLAYLLESYQESRGQYTY